MNLLKYAYTFAESKLLSSEEPCYFMSRNGIMTSIIPWQKVTFLT